MQCVKPASTCLLADWRACLGHGAGGDGVWRWVQGLGYLGDTITLKLLGWHEMMDGKHLEWKGLAVEQLAKCWAYGGL